MSSWPVADPGGLLRRWPSALAVGVAALLWGIDAVSAGQLLLLLPLVHLAAAVVRRQRASWPLLLPCGALVVAVQVQGVVDPTVGVLAAAAGVGAAGLVRGGGRAEVLLQAAALVAWVALVAVALSAAPEVTRPVLAVGWAAHGLWDLWHLRRDAVVSRSYAEWCAVVDLLLAAQLLLLR